MPRLATIGHATMTMSDGRIRYYFVHGLQGDDLLVTPADADSIILWAGPYPADRNHFTAINVRPADASRG
ncbi:hypothetical protein [Kitasatospora sp. NPDC127060]|uniref:hypothetical protein n=1 Tax=Kitasatospora sp. NPDC127060 TaxID=3347121 RepID=UPI0036565E57